MDITASELKNGPKLLQVGEEYAGQRIDNFLLARLKGVPKSRIYRILRKGEVRVNKKRIKPDYRLQTDDVIRIPPLRMSEAPEEKIAQQPSYRTMISLENRILFEDKGLLIINKPSGIAVHGGSGVAFGVIEALRHARPNDRFLELAHRLDRETSGCLVIAKKNSVLRQLHEMLRTGEIEKRYLALVKGYWPKHAKEVDVPLRKDLLRSGERIVNVASDGKVSLTEFRVMQRFDEATLIEAKPRTGRTHQIRVHALHTGHPIAGDDKYGDKDFNKLIRQAGCKRLFLHAASIAFTLPSTGQSISVEAELESDLTFCLEHLKK